MTKVLLFPAEETRFESILKKTYQIIPINNPRDLQDYTGVAEVLILDATRNSQQALNFLKEIICPPTRGESESWVGNKDFGVLVCVSKDGQLEEEFLKSGASSLIKEGYSIDTIYRIIDQVVQDVKGYRELVEAKNRNNLVQDVSRNERVSDGIPQSIFMKAMQREEVLKSFSKILAAGYDLTKLLDIFINVLQEMLKVSRIAILLEDQGRTYKVKAYRGVSPKLVPHLSFSVREGIAGYLRREGTALRLDSLKNIDPQILAQMRSLGVITAVPLLENGRLLGILVFNNKITGLPITDEELELVFALASQVAVAIESSSLLELVSRQRNYLESILDHVSCGIITVRKDGIIVTYNPKAENVLGIKREEILGKYINSLPGDIANLLEQTIRTGQVYFRKELRLAVPEKFIGVSITPINDGQGDITGSVMIFTDITPIKALERETRRLDRLDFTSTVAMRSSHELKNCLVSIKTFAQLLPQRYMDKQFREDFYLVVNKEVDRLNQLVENLLFFAQPLRLDCSSHSIEELIGDAIEILEREDVLSGAEIAKEFGHSSGNVDVDRDAMLRAIKALFYNSIQAMSNGGKIHIVTCDVSKDEKDFLELKITDGGSGIAQELIDKIWDPFFTTKIRGIGLGLTIAHKIIEAHGGSIAISSQEQKGTEVSLWLPKVSSRKGGETFFFPSGRKVVA